MAYMFSISVQCQQDGCRKPRTHRVCRHNNDSVGDYCRKHAEARLLALQTSEQKAADARCDR